MLGKLDSEVLKREILDKLSHKRKEVISSARIGEDCAGLKLEDIILLTTDPITSATENIGLLATHISVNDIAASGGEPIAIMLTILAPENTSEKEIGKIIFDAEIEAKKLNIDIVGGHTEITDAVNRVIVSAVVIGVTKKIVSTSGMINGADIVVTKEIGLEGVSIIASDHKSLLPFLTAEEINNARNCLKDISVLKESRIAVSNGVLAMHDITEGGVFGAVCEMCEGSGLGADIFEDKIPIGKLTKKITDNLGINPYKLISSGSMLIATVDGEKLCKILRENQIECSVIGKANTSKKVINYKDGVPFLLKVEKDEIYKIK